MFSYRLYFHMFASALLLMLHSKNMTLLISAL